MTMGNAYDAITERVLERMAEGTIPWRKPWTAEGGVWPGNLVSGNAYRGSNVLMTGMAGYASPWWLTFKQARTMGGCVRKGERGTRIVRLVTGEREGDEKRFAFLKCYTVFNVAQCDDLDPSGEAGERLNPPPTAPRPAHVPIEAAQDVADRYIDHGGPELTHNGSAAFYSPSADRVTMPAPELFESPHAYHCTLFHELAHSTGHARRLARDGVVNGASFASHAYSFEELVAELSACFLRGAAGVERPAEFENSVAYLQSWMRKLRQNPQWIVKAAAQAQKAADHVAGHAYEAVQLVAAA